MVKMTEQQSDEERKRQLQAEFEDTCHEYQKGKCVLFSNTSFIYIHLVIDRLERAGFF